MTANEFIKRILAKVSMLSTGDIPIKLNGEDIECVIELIENGKGYYINIKQLTKDLALTWEDIQIIEEAINEVHSENPCGISAQNFGDEVFRKFNEQRKK